MKNSGANLLIALVVAAFLGAMGSIALTNAQADRVARWEAFAESGGAPGQPRDRVTNAIHGIRKDGVHVPPDGRAMLDAAAEKRLEAALAKRDDTVPVRIIVWRQTYGSGAYHEVDEQLEEAFLDERSVIVIWEGPEAGQVILTGGKGYVSGFDPQDFAGDPEQTLTAALDDIDPTFYEHHEESDQWGGVVGGSIIGLLIAVAVICVGWIFFLLVRVLTGGVLRLPGGWR